MYLPKLFKNVQVFQKKTFPEATVEGAVNHLKQELEEFLVEDNLQKKKEELADIQFMVLQLDHLIGGGLFGSVKKKLAKNEARVWPSAPDSDGVYNHLEEDDDYPLLGIFEEAVEREIEEEE